jgi:hypothetical protein
MTPGAFGVLTIFLFMAWGGRAYAPVTAAGFLRKFRL